MIFDEPTRCIDVGVKAEIYELMRRLAERGIAILMISSDMEETLGIGNRVAVMHEGAVTGILDRLNAVKRPSCDWPWDEFEGGCELTAARSVSLSSCEVS